MNLHWDIFLLVFMEKEFNFLLNCNGDDNAEMNSIILYPMIVSTQICGRFSKQKATKK